MKYWSDSLHFTQEGYEKIGKDLAAIIEQNQLIRKTE
jgi:lysophospholipase L1-like esterase